MASASSHVLRKVTSWQKQQGRSFYNEMILDATHWQANLPDVVEAFFSTTPAEPARDGAPSGAVQARRAHGLFQQSFELKPHQVPALVTLNSEHWEADGPFEEPAAMAGSMSLMDAAASLGDR